MDKGAAALMTSGDIEVISGVEPRSFTKEGIVLSDGSELAADAVIFAYALQPVKIRMWR